uniref:Ketosynthase family 3 (KS3) domain-containing protein n=1 Tax=Chromera velia CCMP2878 TaxID=1169474 RepID=A0A0G4I7P3_9ALVE|eukprot:Cvel_11706.t1-p1 / transcript=Cvel_11706.t1 / gene=Cvel_11706 / organism=Chromera_velia_CCMP2878 / gene_product=Erythronolide synthase, modules 3 and 4, putative / transcript_product=Erythronolide synthase, modules 3 and 4, putative / location=Cvel_scaffold743:898-10746(-) / protein_length=2033 / sequence_SO=supercontig / SO=protein_coding / is_pseudo=false
MTTCIREWLARRSSSESSSDVETLSSSLLPVASEVVILSFWMGVRLQQRAEALGDPYAAHRDTEEVAVEHMHAQTETTSMMLVKGLRVVEVYAHVCHVNDAARESLRPEFVSVSSPSLTIHSLPRKTTATRAVDVLQKPKEDFFLEIALINGQRAVAVAGPPSLLASLRVRLQHKIAGRRASLQSVLSDCGISVAGGGMTSFLKVSAPCHHSAMQPAVETILQDCQRAGVGEHLQYDRLAMRVIFPVDGTALTCRGADCPPLVEALLQATCVQRGDLPLVARKLVVGRQVSRRLSLSLLSNCQPTEPPPFACRGSVVSVGSVEGNVLFSRRASVVSSDLGVEVDRGTEGGGSSEMKKQHFRLLDLGLGGQRSFVSALATLLSRFAGREVEVLRPNLKALADLRAIQTSGGGVGGGSALGDLLPVRDRHGTPTKGPGGSAGDLKDKHAEAETEERALRSDDTIGLLVQTPPVLPLRARTSPPEKRYSFCLSRSQSNLEEEEEEEAVKPSEALCHKVARVVHISASTSLSTLAPASRLGGSGSVSVSASLQDFSVSLMEMGLDSLDLQMVAASLASTFRIDVSVSDLIDCPNVLKIARFVAKRVDSTRLTKVLRQSEDSRRIPILGMAVRFPGGVTSMESLWEVLCSGKDAIREIPPDRWALEDFFSPDQDASGKVYVHRGGFIEEAHMFDNKAFRIGDSEAREMDPQQRLGLETVFEALTQAGEDKNTLKGTDLSVISATSTNDWARVRSSPKIAKEYTVAAQANAMVSNRISYALGTRGPSFTVDSACSSSLLALDLARQTIVRGQSCLSVALGVQLILDPSLTVAFCKARMLAPDGRTKPFDSQSDGFVRSEGVSALVLGASEEGGGSWVEGEGGGVRPLAYLVGSSVNHGGDGGAVNVPNAEALEELLTLALVDARLLPSDIALLQCHGAGEPSWESAEVCAAGRVFAPDAVKRETPLLLHSVKSVFGHQGAAAGLSGVISTVLMMLHETVPPLLGFQSPHPNVDFKRGSLYPVLKKVALKPTPGTSVLSCGVSSFGFGGANGHVIVQSARTLFRGEKPSVKPPYGWRQNAKSFPWTPPRPSLPVSSAEGKIADSDSEGGVQEAPEDAGVPVWEVEWKRKVSSADLTEHTENPPPRFPSLVFVDVPDEMEEGIRERFPESQLTTTADLSSQLRISQKGSERTEDNRVIVCLGALCESDQGWASSVERPVSDALNLVQSLALRKEDGKKQKGEAVWLVTRGAVSVEGDMPGFSPDRYLHRGLSGAARVLTPMLGRQQQSKEGGSSVGWADLDSSLPVVEGVSRALTAMLGGGEGGAQKELEMVVRRDGIYVPRLRLREMKKEEEEKASASLEGAFLISGGHSRPGLLTAEWLLSQAADQVVLVSREGLPSEATRELEIWKRLSTLMDWDTKERRVVSVACILGDRPSCAAMFQRLNRTLLTDVAGVLHMEGVLPSEETLFDESAASVSEAYLQRVHSAVNIHNSCSSSASFISVSAVSSLLSLEGSVCGAAAASALEGLADFRRSLGLHSHALQMGLLDDTLWALGGGAERRRRAGLASMKTDVGLGILRNLLSPSPSAQIMPCALGIQPVRWKRFLPSLWRVPAFLSEFNEQGEEGRGGGGKQQRSPRSPAVVSTSGRSGSISAPSASSSTSPQRASGALLFPPMPSNPSFSFSSTSERTEGIFEGFWHPYLPKETRLTDAWENIGGLDCLVTSNGKDPQALVPYLAAASRANLRLAVVSPRGPVSVRTKANSSSSKQHGQPDEPDGFAWCSDEMGLYSEGPGRGADGDFKTGRCKKMRDWSPPDWPHHREILEEVVEESLRKFKLDCDSLIMCGATQGMTAAVDLAFHMPHPPLALHVWGGAFSMREQMVDGLRRCDGERAERLGFLKVFFGMCLFSKDVPYGHSLWWQDFLEAEGIAYEFSSFEADCLPNEKWYNRVARLLVEELGHVHSLEEMERGEMRRDSREGGDPNRPGRGCQTPDHGSLSVGALSSTVEESSLTAPSPSPLATLFAGQDFGGLFNVTDTGRDDA